MNYKKIFFTLCCCFALLLSCMPCIKSPITAAADTTFYRSLPDMPVGIQARFDKYMQIENTVKFIYCDSYMSNDEYYICIYQSESSVDDIKCVFQPYNPWYSTLGYQTNFLFYNSEGNNNNFNLLCIFGYKFSTDSWSINDVHIDYVNDTRWYYCEYGLSNGTPEQVTRNILYSSVDISCIYYDNVIRPANSGYNQFECGGYTFSGAGITGGDIDTSGNDISVLDNAYPQYFSQFKVSRDVDYNAFLTWCIQNNKYNDNTFVSLCGNNSSEEIYKNCFIYFYDLFYKLSYTGFKYAMDLWVEQNGSDANLINVATSIKGGKKYQYIYAYYNTCLSEYKASLNSNRPIIDYEAEETVNQEIETNETTDKSILAWIKTIYRTLKDNPYSTADAIQSNLSNFISNVENKLDEIGYNLSISVSNFNNSIAALPKNISAALAPSLQVINSNVKNHDDFTNNDLNAIVAAISEGGSSETIAGGITAAEVDNVLSSFLGANPSGVFGAGGVMGEGGAMLNTIDGIANGINNLNSNFAFGDTSYNQHISNIDNGISDLKNIISDYNNGSSSASGECGYEEESFFVKLHDEIEYWVVPQDIPEQEEIKYLFTDKFGFIMEIRNVTSYMYDIADGNININSEITTTDNPLSLIDNSVATETPQTLSSSGNSTPQTIIKPNTTYNIKIDYLGLDFDAEIINLEYYKSIKPMVDKIIIGLVWGFYLFKLYARLPGIMGGEYFKQKD